MQGKKIVDGLRGEVSFLRDNFGVVHINATNDHDAFFSVGYAHAQDRLWQLQVQKRLASGRLSEIFGADSVETDKYMRTLGLYETAKASWPSLTDDSKNSLVAYADGINAWLAEQHVLPIEFYLLGVQPEKWEVFDSVAWIKVMALNLNGGSFQKDLQRQLIAQKLGVKHANELLPSTLSNQNKVDWSVTDIPEISLENIEHVAAEAYTAKDVIGTKFGLGDFYAGSNSWVVAGQHTVSGHPILSNDPHLGTQLPSLWYLMEIKGHSINATGATVPGLPCIIFGHNKNIAWGGVSMAADTQDLYIERFNPVDLTQVEVNGVMENIFLHEENIKIRPNFLRKAPEPIKLIIRRTRHGPIINQTDNEGMPVALKWTALTDRDTTYDAMLKINYATDWNEFKQSLSFYVAPALNYTYADIKGNIGYSSAGHIPIRQSGNDGRFPLAGWNNNNEWLGWIPADKMPSAYNPESGVIVTANNKMVDDSYEYFLGDNWAPSYRAQRIEELLREKIKNENKLSLDDMSNILADKKSTSSVQILTSLLAMLEVDASEREKNKFSIEAINYLKQWNGIVTEESVAPLIYQAWLSHFQNLLLSSKVTQNRYFLDSEQTLFFHHGFDQARNYWCDDINTAAPEACADVAKKALNAALIELQSRYGSSIDKWTWGKAHTTQLRHFPFSDIRGLKYLFNREVAAGGDTNTIDMNSVTFDKKNKYKSFAYAGYRQLIDLGQLTNNLFIISPGQSGNILSEHYDDLLDFHAKNSFIPMHRATKENKTLVIGPR